MGVIHQGPAASRDRKERTQEQSHSPRMLCTKMHPRRQNGVEILPEAPAVLLGSIPAGWERNMEKHLLLVLTHMPPSSSSSSLLRLHFSTAGTCCSREGFESGWLKFNPSPAVRALSATIVTWGHKLPLLLPQASLSCWLPALSTFPAASLLGKGPATPSLLPWQAGGEGVLGAASPTTEPCSWTSLLTISGQYKFPLKHCPELL